MWIENNNEIYNGDRTKFYNYMLSRIMIFHLLKKRYLILLQFFIVAGFTFTFIPSHIHAKSKNEYKGRINKAKYQSDRMVKSNKPTNIISARIKFWEDVFYKYPNSTVLIHDTKYPELIIDVIDFVKLSPKYPNVLKSKSLQNSIVSKYLSRYRVATQRFYMEGNQATKFGKMEQRIFDVYSRNSYAHRDLLNGKVILRTQSGIAKEFYNAVKRSNKYMKRMEQIFQRNGVPKEYTRLAFVESMFNTHAISNVGATGIWQLMPSTAREYMEVNKYLDERRSVYKSSKVASRILKQNYLKLKSWPLAITAYNHGLGGVISAINYSKSSKLDDIVRIYYGKKNFGFSSSNFYAEFVAAKNIYNKYRRSQKLIKFEAVAMKTKKPIQLGVLIKKLKIDKKTFMELNPCIKEKGYLTSNFYLPRGYELYIPRNKKHLSSLVDMYVYER